MSTFLVPIVVITLAVSSLFILAWLAYPFLLRYRIENAFGLFNSNLKNGANGANGSPGENSPERRNGSNGAHGANSQAGKNGANGLPGQRGIQGVAGHDGDGGSDGEDGEDGVPGFGVVKVCSKMFDPASKDLYYVNGNPIDSHVDSLAIKVTKTFTDQKLRLKDRIQNNFKLDSDKIYFTSVLDSILETNTVPLTPIANKIYTLDNFNDFLDTVKTTFVTQSNTLKTTKDSELVKIEKYNENLKDLRTKRDADLEKINIDPYKGYLRGFNLLSLLPTPDVDFTLQINSLISTPTLTIDSVISDISTLITQQQTIYNSQNSSNQQKTDAAVEISLRTGQINSLKNVKSLIASDINIIKNSISNAYDTGANLTDPNPIVSLSNYGISINTFIPAIIGADALKAAIVTSNNAINTAIALCQTNLETTISPYRTANPIP